MGGNIGILFFKRSKNTDRKVGIICLAKCVRLRLKSGKDVSENFRFGGGSRPPSKLKPRKKKQEEKQKGTPPGRRRVGRGGWASPNFKLITQFKIFTGDFNNVFIVDFFLFGFFHFVEGVFFIFFAG